MVAVVCACRGAWCLKIDRLEKWCFGSWVKIYLRDRMFAWIAWMFWFVHENAWCLMFMISTTMGMRWCLEGRVKRGVMFCVG